MLSYWEQQSFTQYDHVIAGSGIVGLSTAIELKERYPQSSVLVLERGLLPTGASSRNAGFACMGSLTELLDESQYNSEEEIVTLYERRRYGLELLRMRLGDGAIGYKANGSYELMGTAELPMLERIGYLNKLLAPITGKPAFKTADDKISAFGFDTNFTRAMIENTCEGELHTGKMLHSLMQLALQKGVEIKTGAEVTGYEDDGKMVMIHAVGPHRQQGLTLHAATFSICTNAFAKHLLPDEDVIPGRGQVLITEPVEGLRFRGVYHFDRGYYYFREIDGRVLLGGGRNLDFAGETTTDIALSETIQADLEQKLCDIILPGTAFKIAQRWAGIMAFGSSKEPIVKSFSPRVYGAFRMGGMGVALGSEVAKTLASLVIM